MRDLLAELQAENKALRAEIRKPHRDPAAERIYEESKALRKQVRDLERELQPLRAMPVPPSFYGSAPPSPVPPEAAPWQGYRPIAGWTEPAKAKAAKARLEKVITTVALADAHIPHHLLSAWACGLGIIKDVKPDRVVINGDLMDLESLSRHPKSRPDLARLAAEFHAGNVALDEVQSAAPDAEIVILEGNHEGRASRYANEYGQLDGMLSVPISLYIEPRADYHRETSQLRGVRWIPLRMQPFAIGAVRYLHGVSETKYHSAFHAESLGPRNPGQHVLVSAHMHGWQSFGSASGFVAFSCPWLGDESRPVFQAYTKGRPRPWHLGVLLIEEAGDSVTVTPIFIQNGRALVGGHVIQSAA
jgi:hypothetical protein